LTGDEPTYCVPVPVGALRQGEILSSVDQYIIILKAQSATELPDVTRKMHPFAVILSQDCDLAQDFAARFGDSAETALKQMIPNVLLCEVDIADNTKTGGTIARGSDIWKRIIQNKDERFQYLRGIAADSDAEGKGVPHLLIDFKRTFTLPTEMLYGQLQGVAKRRAVLASPYVEHLSSRYAYFISRVALPRDHHAE
jgi:hypothetical protein